MMSLAKCLQDWELSPLTRSLIEMSDEETCIECGSEMEIDPDTGEVFCPDCEGMDDEEE